MPRTLGPVTDTDVPVDAPVVARSRAAHQAGGMEQTVEQQLVHAATDEMRVPFWVVLAGVGVGAFWALAGVLVGSRLRRRA